MAPGAHLRESTAVAIATAPETGIDLMVARRQAGLTQWDVAAAMGVNRQRISALERMFRPPHKAIERFLAAVESAAAK
jgi:DNA-binding transcriptional regulator YiaG